ncbi:MAG: phosphate ABC transporter ATP-binding protein [Candidatus Latescibacteria bacterium]|jgi:phosphate transport system ATP-binding protein|nr:phosphate ABC transporter ATP-binding protein [Candidatus Latescibacterota bacterium]MBT5831048.1 phosphate ABC transporter ATP-binding protein [Candidatus Latescibacterota bacterium]
MASVSLGLVRPEPELEGMVTAQDLQVWFGRTHVLRGITAEFQAHCINGIVGPSGSGKSTLIRCLNRMNDEVAGHKLDGRVVVAGADVYAKENDVVSLRKAVGMVFQKPCVFPKSIAENVVFGVQHQRTLDKYEKVQIVEDNLKAVALWDEVRHRLDDSAGSLSLGQQQRLCLARTLAVKPRVILLDEPTSSLDPVSARAIEDLMVTLKQEYTLILVTHNIQQARRVADHLVFMCDGKVIEQGAKALLFNNPQHEQTRKYLQEEYCECDE